MKLNSITCICTKDHPDWEFPLHSHADSLELSLVLDGRGTLFSSGRNYSIQKGDFIINNALIPHSEKTSTEAPLEQLCINLSGVRRSGYRENEFIHQSLCPVIPTGDFFVFIRELFLILLKLYEDQPEGYEDVIHDSLRNLLSVIDLILPKDQRENNDSVKFPIIRDVLEYLDCHYQENISLDDLAHKFYFSSYYLARKFKDETGYTVNQYLINRRMGEAERMLLYEDYSTAEIAKRVGYGNIHYFYKTFRKYAGCTPNKFRQIYQK